jgi:hypothetical protein
MHRIRLILVFNSCFILFNSLLQSVCNLGVWCVSVQQLEPLVIQDQTTPLLTAIVHALDNQFGSLSTTFEAAQVILNVYLNYASLLVCGLRKFHIQLLIKWLT